MSEVWWYEYSSFISLRQRTSLKSQLQKEALIWLKGAPHFSSTGLVYPWKYWNKEGLTWVILLFQAGIQPFTNFREDQLLIWITPSRFCHVLSTLCSHKSVEMEEAEKLTWDFPHLAKLGAYYTIAPYQFLQTAENAQAAFLRHFFSEVSKGCQQKNLFSRYVCSIYMHIMYSCIFSQVWNSNIRSDGHNTSLQCVLYQTWGAARCFLLSSPHPSIPSYPPHTSERWLTVSGTVDTEHEQGHSMPH